MPHARTRLGDLGEQAAERFLLARGYEVVARKWRCGVGEIDLVVRTSSTLVFVEVRTRRAPGRPEESLSLRKRRRLAHLAYAFVEHERLSGEQAWRIDVIAVSIDQDGRLAIQHIQDAVEEE